MGKKRQALVHNIVDVPWQQFPGHFGGALSKALVRPESSGSPAIDYRISTYLPMAHVELHAHKVQEQIYHVLDGEGVLELDGEKRVVRRHDVIYIPPGVKHAIANQGLDNLTFLVVTVPADEQ